MEWLQELEDQIKRATQEIAALRKQNRSLGSQVKRLKREAQAAGSASWEEEREELRRRGEKIASTLASILD